MPAEPQDWQRGQSAPEEALTRLEDLKPQLEELVGRDSPFIWHLIEQSLD